MQSCKYCGSVDLVEHPCPPASPHHAECRCRACGRHLGWVAAPMTPDRAAAFTMPLGTFQGLTLASIAGTARGVDYLRWLVAQSWVKPTMRRAVECHLEYIDRLFPPSSPEPRRPLEDYRR